MKFGGGTGAVDEQPAVYMWKSENEQFRPTKLEILQRIVR